MASRVSNCKFSRENLQLLTREAPDEERTRLQAIPNLTPGDFRTVREELYYLKGRQTNAARLEALEAESAAKGLVRAKIGF